MSKDILANELHKPIITRNFPKRKIMVVAVDYIGEQILLI